MAQSEVKSFTAADAVLVVFVVPPLSGIEGLPLLALVSA